MEEGNMKFIWKIKNFSNPEVKLLRSDVFSLGPYKWEISAYPKGNNVDGFLSIYLRVSDTQTNLPSGWSQKAKYSFTLINQMDNKLSLTRVATEHEFNSERRGNGFPSFISHKQLFDLDKGYLVQDTCIIKVDVTIFGDAFIEEFGEEVIDAFFVDLNSIIFPKKVVSADQEAKEALEEIEEALNMLPEDVNSPGRISQLKDAFDVLSSLEDSLIAPPETKEKLLSIKDNLITLPGRAAKAVENIKLFKNMELMKKSVDRKLVRCLTEFEEVKAETLQNKYRDFLKPEKNGEMKRKKKEMYVLSNKLKAEMDALVKNLLDYEAKMKAAKEEEKVVATEWSKMKQLYSSLNLKDKPS